MIYVSNLNQAITKITGKLKQINNRELNSTLKVAAITTQGNIMRRVFNDGKATQGGFIGSYSTKPLAVGRKSFTRQSSWNQVFAAKKYAWTTIRGKKTKAGKPVRLKVLPGGYKQLRSIQGKDVSTVNLDYSGKLKGSMIVEAIPFGYVVGFLPYGAKLSQYQEQKWNKPIFYPSKYEKAVITKIINGFIVSKLK
jgi:hypothetical protein